MKKFLLQLEVLLALFALFTAHALFAQTTPSNQMVVSPAKIEVTLDPGEEVTRQVRITNDFDHVITVHVLTEDIGPGTDQSLGAELLGDTKGTSTLRDYIHPLINSFSIKSGETLALPVTILLPADI